MVHTPLVLVSCVTHGGTRVGIVQFQFALHALYHLVPPCLLHLSHVIVAVQLLVLGAEIPYKVSVGRETTLVGGVAVAEDGVGERVFGGPVACEGKHGDKQRKAHCQ